MAASWEHCHYFPFEWTSTTHRHHPKAFLSQNPLEEAAKGQDQLTFISCTLALRRTALISPLSSPGLSYRLSHRLINCCLPVRWTAADFKEANATFFGLKALSSWMLQKSLWSPLPAANYTLPYFPWYPTTRSDFWSVKLKPTTVSRLWWLWSDRPRAWWQYSKLLILNALQKSLIS